MDARTLSMLRYTYIVFFLPYSLAFRLIACGRSDIHPCRITVDCGGAVSGKHIGVLTELIADRSWSAKGVLKLPVKTSLLFWFIISEIRSSDVRDYANCSLVHMIQYSL
jgi:hypothetical protein